jgi:hypothetical protein
MIPSIEPPVHLLSFDGSGLTLCCNRSSIELGKTDLLTHDDTQVFCNDRDNGTHFNK